jgi:hypothetical protein
MGESAAVTTLLPGDKDPSQVTRTGWRHLAQQDVVCAATQEIYFPPPKGN